jgi:hypothetical protein
MPIERSALHFGFGLRAAIRMLAEPKAVAAMKPAVAISNLLLISTKSWPLL